MSSVGLWARANLRLISLKLCGGVLQFLTVIIEHTLGLIIDNVDALQSVENGCHDGLSGLIYTFTLVLLKQVFKLFDGSILVTNTLIEGLDVAFLEVGQLGDIGMGLCESEVPALVDNCR